MLAQQPGEKSWVIDSTRSLNPGVRYMVLVVVPQEWSEDQAAQLLAQQGWNVTSFNAPSDSQKQAIAALSNLGSPNAWNVIATWQGAPTTLPKNIGNLYYGPIYFEYAFSGPPNIPSTPPEPLPIWPMAVAFVSGVVLFGGAWWYLKRSDARALPAETLTSMEATGAHPIATHGKLRWVSSTEEAGPYEIVWWGSRFSYQPIARFGGARQASPRLRQRESFYTARATFQALRHEYDAEAFDELDRARMLVQRAAQAARSEWKKHEASIGTFGGAEAIARYEWDVIHRLHREAA